ncbi:polyprenyl synthetase family protein [Millionella massiliensis]|uniref:polyprenyl synthetase family protein n=1 Tax=Millionella massiliensis TaxID=1871023 RepID=UPI0023A85AD2|nr:polyprenyl synthetase family protein [Millionella massiliensis]
MARLEDIIAPVESEFRAFRELLNQVTLSELPFMRPITRDILHSGGKQMRPLLTLLVAALHDDARDPRVQAGAVLIEMIHWSTLVHDDVIDEAYVRRGQWTPGTLLRSKSAVLVGDYLFSKGLSQASRAGSFGAMRSATRAIELIVDGELMQMEHARRLDNSEATYTEIIRHKTAALIASAAECGVLPVCDDRPDAPQVTAMYRFGELLGLAFQIKDDILDFGFAEDGSQLKTGKVLCNDLRERKMTLPLIHALDEAAPADRRNVLKHLRRAAERTASVEWLRSFVAQSNGIAYSVQTMERYLNEALGLLEAYPASPVRKALQEYAAYVVGRSF